MVRLAVLNCTKLGSLVFALVFIADDRDFAFDQSNVDITNRATVLVLKTDFQMQVEFLFLFRIRHR